MGRTTVPAALAVIALEVASAAQRPQQPTFKAGVNLVQLDVSVLDKDGRPVRGLTAEDFTVFENGKPQPIVAFAPVDVADGATATMAEAKAAAWTHEVSPDVATNRLDNRRLVMLVLDDATLMPAQPDPQAEEHAQEAARQVIAQLGPDDLAAVTFTGVATPPQDFTADRPTLNAAVDRFIMQTEPTCYEFRRAVATMNETVEALASVQDRRKTLVYIGGGMPVDFPTSRLLISVPLQEQLTCGAFIVAMLKDVFVSAQRANVNIYTIDPFGLRTNALPGSAAAARIDTQKIVASNTGGRAIVETNDFIPGIAQMFRENSSYYLMGYAPSNAKDDGTFRRIDVKVDRPHLEVRTRKNYYAPDAKKLAAAAKPQPSASVAAITHVLPKTDVALSVAAAPFAVPGSASQAVALVVGVEEPTPATTDDLELTVAALDAFGKLTASVQQQIHVILRPQPSGASRAQVASTVSLAPGAYEILIGVASRRLGKDGSVYADVDVPNFAGTTVTLSGVVLRVPATPGRGSTAGVAGDGAAMPQGSLAPGLPEGPTTVRTFAAADHVSAFVEIYQGGKSGIQPVALRTRVTDDRDRVIEDSSDTVAASQFDPTTRSEEDRVDLPLARLTPGRYLLTLEATLGKMTAERDVVFTVR